MVQASHANKKEPQMKVKFRNCILKDNCLAVKFNYDY